MAMSAVNGRIRRANNNLCSFKGTLTIGGTLGEDTCSETAAHEHRAVIKNAETLNVDLYIDAADSIEALDLDFGDEVDVDLRIGSTGLSYVDWAFIVEKTEITFIDNNGFVTVNCVMHSQEAKPTPGNGNWS